MFIVDVHNHYYPPEYLSLLRASSSPVKVTDDAEGNPLVHYPGDYNIIVQGHRDIDYRQSMLERSGVDLQVITFTTPGVHIEQPEVAVAWARKINDAMATIARERSARFSALATLPLNDPAASVAELDRAVTGLGLPGAMLFSNVNGTALSDDRYLPLYRKADALGCVLHIHPTYPVGVEAMTDYWLMPLIGFPLDTTLAAAKLVFSGIAERHPGITWVLGHLGGAIPYLAERLDRGYKAFAECRANISERPSDQLRRFYFDTVNFDQRALGLAIEFAGAGQLLAGSDYPHQIGSIRSMLDSINGLEIDDASKQAILGGNATKVYGLTELQ